MRMEAGSKLVMIGDSITDCGRDYQAIPAGFGSFGEGYVSLVNAMLAGLMPESRITVINKGVSGNTIVDLASRWRKDVLDEKPDYLTIMIGVNDVWRHFDAILQPIEKVDEDTFERVYENLIHQTKEQTDVKKIFILSPFIIIEEKEFAMRKMVEKYAQIAKNLAQKQGLIFVDVQGAMDRFLREMPCYAISGDHVHPNLAGHAIIAKAFLDAVEFQWKE